MPRKTKEINEEKTVKKDLELDKKINTFINAVLDIEEPVVDAKKKKAKSSTTKSTAKTKVAKEEKATPKKTTKAKTEDKKKTAKKAAKTTSADTSTKKVTVKSASKATKETKKTSDKKATKTTKKSTDKETTKAAKVTPKTADKKSAKTSKATSTTTKTAAKSAKAKATKVASPTVVEYYDLPYKYNQTVVKVLYQNPTTLFVYWEISDNDIENYKKQYGENFFETTRPVLVVYNDTMNYTFDVDINDFANSWYFNINDSKCDYRVELIRRPIFYNPKINSDYIYITSSNKIETPNDRILFSTDEPYTVYFRNTKNGAQRKVNLTRLLEQLNLTNKDFGFPIVRNVYDLYKNIYHIENVEEFGISLTNPSSGNPSSHSLSSRFI